MNEAIVECRVYWGSHGCDLPRGHDGEHVCDIVDDECPSSEGYELYGQDALLAESGEES